MVYNTISYSLDTRLFGLQPAAKKTQETEFLRYGGKEQTYFPQYSYPPILGKYI